MRVYTAVQSPPTLLEHIANHMGAERRREAPEAAA